MAVKDYYKSYWAEGGIGHGIHHDTYPELRRLLEAHVTSTSACLDIGCGDGKTCGVWLHDHAGSYIGVDVAENVVMQARSLGLDARTIDDATSLPFSADSFDLAVCTEVLEHLFDPLAAAQEAYRVLRPGGVFVVTVPNVGFWRDRLYMLMNRWAASSGEEAEGEPWHDPHIRFFKARTLKSMLVRAGFSPVEVGGHYGAALKYFATLQRAKSMVFSTPVGKSERIQGMVRQRPASRLYQELERRWPSLFAWRLHAVAKKPTR